jgi:hypothetical protein
MTAPIALRLAQGIPETADNFGVLRELIRVLLNDVNAEEKEDD